MNERNAKVMRRFVRSVELDKQNVSDIRQALSCGPSDQKSRLISKMRDSMPELYAKRQARGLVRQLQGVGVVDPYEYFSGWRKDFNPQ